jgi:ferritin-like metal-binding protein YciE
LGDDPFQEPNIMPTATTGGRSFTSDAALEIYTTGLKNAHALEQQAMQLMERQVERYERYPEMTQRLQQHIRETEGQIARLEELMHGLGTERSALKDWATSIMGNLAAIGHSIMPDEILKNTFANHAFENFEIASYTSLIAMAEATGNPGHVPALRDTLNQEQRMASWILENTPMISLKYIQLSEQGAKADR